MWTENAYFTDLCYPPAIFSCTVPIQLFRLLLGISIVTYCTDNVTDYIECHKYLNSILRSRISWRTQRTSPATFLQLKIQIGDGEI